MTDVPALPAASVVIVDDRTDLHVLVARRRPGSLFVGGMIVFPGGGVDPEDRSRRARGRVPRADIPGMAPDEALWAARIDPAARRVSRPAARRLHAAIIETLREGVEHGGTTLRDYRNAEDGEGGHQHHLRCYGRAGEPCERCGTVLRRRVIDARSTTSCPVCQRR